MFFQSLLDEEGDEEELDYLSFIHKFGNIISAEEAGVGETSSPPLEAPARTLAYGAGWLRKLG